MTAPNLFCADHPVGTLQPCGPCRDARLLAAYQSSLARWKAEHAADKSVSKRASRRIPTVIGVAVAAVVLLAVAS